MTDMMPPNGPSWLIAYVTDCQRQHPEGLILEASNGFKHEQEEVGSIQLADHTIPEPPRNGLLVLDGWVDFYEEGSVFRGEWRMLSFAELTRLRFGAQVIFEQARAPEE
jgi:hypothetical protein